MTVAPHLLTNVIIWDADQGGHLKLEFNPEELIDSKDVNFASIQVPGMSHPRIQFVGGGERVLQFVVRLFYADRTAQDVQADLRWLQSLAYPEHGGSMLKHAPHRVYLDWGYLIETTDHKWVVRRVETRSYLFHPDTLLPLGVDVALELVEYIETSTDYSDIRM